MGIRTGPTLYFGDLLLLPSVRSVVISSPGGGLLSPPPAGPEDPLRAGEAWQPPAAPCCPCGFRTACSGPVRPFPWVSDSDPTKVALTQSSREGKELGARSKQRNGENPVKWKLSG